MLFWLYILTLACINVFMTLSWNLVFGKGKILHFGHQAHSLFTAYAIWVSVVQYDVPMIVGMIAGLTLSLALGALMSWLSVRLEEDAFGVMSIAVHLILFAVILNWQSVTRGALGIPGIPRPELMRQSLPFFMVTALCMAVWVFAVRRFDKSKYGRALEALSESEWHAEALGISQMRTRQMAFALSSTGAFLAALIYPPFLLLLTPNDYGFPSMIFYVIIILAGGPGKLWGVFGATFAVIFLKEAIRFIGLPADMIGPVRLILFGLIMFVFVCIRKDSLFPHQRRI